MAEEEVVKEEGTTEDQNTEVVIKRPLTPRDIALAEVTARYKNEVENTPPEKFDVMDDETGVVTAVESDDVKHEEVKQEEPVVTQEEPVQAAEKVAEEGQKSEQEKPSPLDPNKEYSLIVDGKEIKVLGAKIFDAGVRTLQKETSADLKLNLASQMLREAQAARESGLPAKGVQETPAQNHPNEMADVDLAKAIQFGTEEEAAKAIQQLRSTGKAVSQEDVRSFVRQQVQGLVTDELAFREATSFLNTEYSDMMQNPHLRQLFFLEEERARQGGDARPYKDLYKAIGDGIRKSLNIVKPVTTAPSKDQRIEAKRSAPTMPVTAAARMSSVKQDDKPRTSSEIIAAMAQRRGQTNLLRR